MVANATVMSIFTYMITVWGGTEGYILQAAQVLQNKAARTVTKLGWFTSQKILLQQTNWLSIKQMIFYHTVIQVWQVRTNLRPEYLKKMFKPDYNQQTRIVTGGNLRVPEMKTSLAKKGMGVRGAMMWNSLPLGLKNFKGKQLDFKRELKTWVKMNDEM